MAATTRSKSPRQLRLFSAPYRPSREQRERGLVWVSRARKQLEQATRDEPDNH